MVLKHPEYAHGISDAELIKEAIEFCDEELDGFEGMDYDSDSEVCCQRSNTFIRELVVRLTAALSSRPAQEAADEAPLTVSYPVHKIAHDILITHTGQEGGCPRIDWYKLRSEISDAIAVALEKQRRIDTAPHPATPSHGADTSATDPAPKGHVVADREAALQAAADANGGYINGKTKQIVIAALNAFGASSPEAHRHAVALRQCSLFAADVGEHIVKAMTDAAGFLDRTPSPAPNTLAPVTAGQGVEVIVTDVLTKHCGQQGGSPRVNWYALRNELVAALATPEQSKESQ